MAKQPLGRGLSALLGENSAPTAGPGDPHEIDIDLVAPNPDQPRKRFAEEQLDELARSIAANGIVQPIVVRRKGGRYEIIAGERRWRAAQRAGLRKIPAVTREVSDDKLLELALVENIQRQELNPIEEAAAYKKLIESIGLTQEEVSQRVGKERSLIATSLRLLNLNDEVREFIAEGKLSAGHGRALLMAENRIMQLRLARVVIENAMSVRETERAVKKSLVGGDKKKAAPPKPKKDPNVTMAETKLMRRLGTNVKILPKGEGGAGKIEVEYYNKDDLNRIYQMIIDPPR
jgi:ParB family chromosome partitioning protein